VFKKLSRLTSLTEKEITIFVFVISMLVLGVAVKVITSTTKKPTKKFTYTTEDSLFAYFRGLNIDSGAAELAPLHARGNDSISPVTEKIPYSKKNPTKVINLNTASEEELSSLPGIGKKTALAILEYRKKKRKFTSVSELLNVKGIGEKKLEKLKPFLLTK